MPAEEFSINREKQPERSRLSPELREFVRNSEFKAWFGDWENNPENASKLVDENGEPLLVYAGLPAGITEFSGAHRLHTGNDELGYYFTKRFANARGMAEQRRDSVSDEIVSSSVYGVFLNIRRPITVNSRDRITTTRITTLPKNGDGYINDKLQEIVVFDPAQIAIVNETPIQ